MKAEAAPEQDGVGLEYLANLTFYDDVFEYRGKSHEYKNIEHIEFPAVVTKHRVKFIPTGKSYHANLFLHFGAGRRLHIKQESSFLRGKQEQRSEAVMRAASIFMNMTFNQRVEAYEQQMHNKGFVRWDIYKISRNGNLFRNNELRFNLLDDNIGCALGPFQLECRKQNLGMGDRLKGLLTGTSEVIGISLDRDCFIYIMKHYLDLSWRDQPVPEKSCGGKEIFNEALLILGAKLCKVDGRVSTEEIARFKQYFGIDENTHPGAGKILMEATRTNADARESARRIQGLLRDKAEILEHILFGLMQIAAADGQIDAAEEEFIEIVALEFGLSPAEIRRLFLIFDQAREGSRETGRDASHPKGSPIHIQHLEVLGLGEHATFFEIKVAYRNLARKHHPDILRAQGLPIDDIQSAEKVLKVINTAYQWLEQNHRMDRLQMTAAFRGTSDI